MTKAVSAISGETESMRNKIRNAWPGTAGFRTLNSKAANPGEVNSKLWLSVFTIVTNTVNYRKADESTVHFVHG